MRNLALMFMILFTTNATANTAWFQSWQAYKPVNWQTIGSWYSCIGVTNISSGSIEVTVNYYDANGDAVTPPLVGHNSGPTPKAVLAPRQSVGWCTDTSKLNAGSNLYGAGTIMATPIDGQTEPVLVIASSNIRNLSPVGNYNAWTNIPVNGGLPF